MNIHQKLVDDAYDLWENGLTRDEFLSKVIEDLSPLYKIAVQLANLNYQVENGGFSQWYYNNYSVDMDDLINFLRSHKDLDKNEEVLNILLDVEEVLNEFQDVEQEIDQLSRNLAYYRDDIKSCLFETFDRRLNYLDKKFYTINDDWLKSLNNFFLKEIQDGNNSRTGTNG